MRESFWAAECLRFCLFVLVGLYGSRFLLRASQEEGWFAWILRGLVLCVAAHALGYV